MTDDHRAATSAATPQPGFFDTPARPVVPKRSRRPGGGKASPSTPAKRLADDGLVASQHRRRSSRSPRTSASSCSTWKRSAAPKRSADGCAPTVWDWPSRWCSIAAPGEFTCYHEADVEKLLLDLVMADRGRRFQHRSLRPAGPRGLRLVGPGEDPHARSARRHPRTTRLPDLAEPPRAREPRHVQVGRRPAVARLVARRPHRSDRGLLPPRRRRDARLFELGKEQGYLLYRDVEDRPVRLPVRW